jgi:hypothetical protein
MTALAIYWKGEVAGMSAFLGVVLALVNFWLWTWLGKALVQKQSVKPIKLAAVFVIKMLGLFGSLAVVLLYVPAHMLSFLAGLSVIFLAIAWEGLMGLKEGDEAPNKEDESHA